MERESEGSIRKTFAPEAQAEFDSEVYWLRKLEGLSSVPRLLDVDETKLSISLSYEGERITRENAPHDWRDQVGKFLEDLKFHGCAHNDLLPRHVLVNPQGQLKVIDFGFATSRDGLSLESRLELTGKLRIFEDSFISNYLERVLVGGSGVGVPHVVVLWDTGLRSDFLEHLDDDVEVLLEMAYLPSAFDLAYGSGRRWLSHFYPGKPLGSSRKASSKFLAFVVWDPSPQFAVRSNQFSGERQTVNARLFDLKARLRNARTGVVHVSDHYQETLDNGRLLSVYPAGEPDALLKTLRPQFPDWNAVFLALNSLHGSRYVVLRGVERNRNGNLTVSGDLDILVDDYFLTKAALGGKAFKQELPHSHPSFGIPVDYGGRKVANRIIVDGEERVVDVRFVGDNYFPAPAERMLLDNRSFHEPLWAPNEVDYLGALAYHARVHKQSIPEKYVSQILGGSAAKNGLQVSRGKNLRSVAADVADDWIATSGSSYSRPREISVLMNVSYKEAPTLILEDVRSSIVSLSRGRLVEAAQIARAGWRSTDWPIALRILLGSMFATLLPFLYILGRSRRIRGAVGLFAERVRQELRS